MKIGIPQMHSQDPKSANIASAEKLINELAGKESLNFPTTFVTPEFAAVLSSSLYSVPFMGGDQFNTTFGQKFLVKLITIIGLIANKFARKNVLTFNHRMEDKNDENNTV